MMMLQQRNRCNESGALARANDMYQCMWRGIRIKTLLHVILVRVFGALQRLLLLLRLILLVL